jgi:hypothetical protein
MGGGVAISCPASGLLAGAGAAGAASRLTELSAGREPGGVRSHAGQSKTKTATATVAAHFPIATVFSALCSLLAGSRNPHSSMPDIHPDANRAP